MYPKAPQRPALSDLRDTSQSHNRSIDETAGSLPEPVRGLPFFFVCPHAGSMLRRGRHGAGLWGGNRHPWLGRGDAVACP